MNLHSGLYGQLSPNLVSYVATPLGQCEGKQAEPELTQACYYYNHLKTVGSLSALVLDAFKLIFMQYGFKSAARGIKSKSWPLSVLGCSSNQKSRGSTCRKSSVGSVIIGIGPGDGSLYGRCCCC